MWQYSYVANDQYICVGCLPPRGMPLCSRRASIPLYSMQQEQQHPPYSFWNSALGHSSLHMAMILAQCSNVRSTYSSLLMSSAVTSTGPEMEEGVTSGGSAGRCAQSQVWVALVLWSSCEGWGEESLGGGVSLEVIVDWWGGGRATTRGTGMVFLHCATQEGQARKSPLLHPCYIYPS